jgi:hypothetical protein
LNILIVNLALSTFVLWIAARLYVFPTLADLSPRTILLPILLLHAFRHLGLMFLAPGATQAGMPPQFAVPAALGDLTTAFLALLAIPAVNRNTRAARPLVWMFSVVGSVDLTAAMVLSRTYGAPPFMGAAYWIPALWVPVLLVTHYVAFVVLPRRWPAHRGDGSGLPKEA